MADINLSDITGVPVLMPIERDWVNVPSPPLPTGLGAGSGAYAYYRWKRSGTTARIQFQFVKDGTAGTGTSAVLFPAVVSMGTPVAAIVPAGVRTFLVQHTVPNTFSLVVASVAVSAVGFNITNMGSTTNIQGANVGAGATIAADFSVEISEWAGQTHEAIGTGVATADRAGLVSNAVKPTALVASDFTTQTNCYIEETDLPLNRNYWTLNNGVVTVYLWFDTFSIATLVPSFSWVFPQSIPRPKSSAGGLGIVFDNSGSVGAAAQVTMLSNGTFQVGKLGGGNFSGGSHTSYLRMQFSWPIN